MKPTTHSYDHFVLRLVVVAIVANPTTSWFLCDIRVPIVDVNAKQGKKKTTKPLILKGSAPVCSLFTLKDSSDVLVKVP